MKILEEIKKVESAKPIVNAPSFTPQSPIAINSSVVEFSEPVRDYFKNRALRTKLASPTEEYIQKRLSTYAGEKLKTFHSIVANHPATGPISGWNIEKLKVDYLDNTLLFAAILDDSSGEGKRWLVLFTGDSRNNPIYVEIQTKFFDINSFPMKIVNKISAFGGAVHTQAVNTATELTQKKFEDTVKSTRVGRISSKL